MCEYKPVHAYGGREHDQSAPVAGCLICERDEALAQADESRQLSHRLVEEIVDLKQSLTMLRDAWNSHMDKCTNEYYQMVDQMKVTPEDLARWQNAPSATASARTDEDYARRVFASHVGETAGAKPVRCCFNCGTFLDPLPRDRSCGSCGKAQQDARGIE